LIPFFTMLFWIIKMLLTFRSVVLSFVSLVTFSWFSVFSVWFSIYLVLILSILSLFVLISYGTMWLISGLGT
jgi:hypothetical protein